MSTSVSTDDQLLKRTLRVTAILLGACVLFVGALSLVAVLVTSKAFGGGTAPESAKSEVRTEGAPGGPQGHERPTAKKPLSI